MGETNGYGWITFIPDDVNAPIARTRIQSDGGGYFSIDALEGLLLGDIRLRFIMLVIKSPMSRPVFIRWRMRKSLRQS